MSNPNDRNRYGNPSRGRAQPPSYDRTRDEDPNEERNMWQSREEDGGWGREQPGRDNDWARNNGGANRFERGNERRYSDAAYGLSEGSGRRGYGTQVYGESGLGEANRGETWRAGDGGWGSPDPYDLHGGSNALDRGGNDARRARDLDRDYSRGFGPNHGFGYQSGSGTGPRSADYRRGFGYGFGAGGYDAHDDQRRRESEYSPTGLDRDRLGAQGQQGYGREFGGHAGRGPKGYKRTDERIREDVCERLSRDDEVDASEISVRVEGGEVTLEGSVETRHQKHRAEELAADVLGVDDVHNRVRVRKSLLAELKDKVTGDEAPVGGHAGSGTKTTSAVTPSPGVDHNRH